jgi:hypothetical protein
MTSIPNGNDGNGESSPCGVQIDKAKRWALGVIAVVVVAVVGAVSATTVGGSNSSKNGTTTPNYRAVAPIHSQAEIQAIVAYINNQTLSGQTLVHPIMPNETAIASTENLALALVVNATGLAQAYTTATAWERFRLVQVYALLTLYVLDGYSYVDTFKLADYWLDGVLDECNWFGVTCTSKDLGAAIGTVDVVTKINLFGQNLRGSLSNDLGLLTHLESFIVEINELTGTLPATIGLWTDLREFKVTLNNKLTGRIPVSIANWTLLESIVIFNTTLTGSIPDSLCDTLTEASIGCNVNCSCCTKLCLEDLL